MRAEVFKLEASSGHADQGELVEWAQKVCSQGKVRQICLVHTEMDAATELKVKFAEAHLPPVVIPDREQIVGIDRLR